MVFDQGRKPELKLACFLRARQKLTGRRLSKSRYGTNVRARFVRKEKSLLKNFSNQNERSFDLLSFEGKRIDVGANKLKLRRFETRAFCDKMRSFCTISASTFWKIQPEGGNETLIFKRFRLFRSCFDSSDCQSPSKCFLLSNFDIPAYYLAGFSKRLSTVTSPVSRVPPLPLPNFPVLSSYKNGNCLSIPTSLDILDNIHPRR